MEFFFEPRGIAVVGATTSKEKGGNIIVSNLKRGYQGQVYPVNPVTGKSKGLIVTLRFSMFQIP